MVKHRKAWSLIALVMVVLANGLHLPIVQGFAWAKMALDDRESPKFTTALQNAMETTEVCGICVYVANQKATSDENGISYWQIVSNLLLIMVVVAPFSKRPEGSWTPVAEEGKRLSGTVLEHASPPPRVVLA